MADPQEAGILQQAEDFANKTAGPADVSTPNLIPKYSSPGTGHSDIDSSVPNAAPPDTSAPFKTGEEGAGSQPGVTDTLHGIAVQVSHGLPWALPGFHDESPGFIERYTKESNLEQQNELYGIPKISKEEANRRATAAGMPATYGTDTDPSVVDFQIQNFSRLKQAQDEITQGRQPFGGSTLWANGLGILGGFSDPRMLALMGLTGGISETLGLRAGLLALDEAGVAKAVSGTAGLAMNAGSNLLLNTTLGIPGHYIEAGEHQAPAPSWLDTAKEIGLSTLGGTAMHYALSGLLRSFHEGYQSFMQMPDDQKLEAAKTAVTQEEAGVKQDISSPVYESQQLHEGRIKDGSKPLPVVPVGHPSDISYHMGAMNDGSQMPTESMGPGFQASSDVNRVNNLADKRGVINVAKDSKFINLDQPMQYGEGKSNEQAKKMFDAISELPGMSKINFGESEEGRTLKNILDDIRNYQDIGRLPEDTLAKIQELAKKEGVQGYQYNGTDADGNPTDNRIHLFDQPTPTEVQATDPSQRPQVTAQQKESLLSDQLSSSNSKYKDPAVDKDIKAWKNKAPIDAGADYLKNIAQESMETHQRLLNKMIEENPAAKAALEDFSKNDTKWKMENSMVENLADCVVSSLE